MSVYTFGETLRKVRSIAWQLDQHADRPRRSCRPHRREPSELGDRVSRHALRRSSDRTARSARRDRNAYKFPLRLEAKLAFIDEAQVERFAEITAKLGHAVPTVVWPTAGANSSSTSPPPYEGEVAGGRGGSLRWDEWTAAEPSNAEKFPLAAADDDIAVLMYTSGTTGTPKGVPLTHGNILAELEGVNYVLHLSDKEQILSLLPLFHCLSADRKSMDRDGLRMPGRLSKGTDASRALVSDARIQTDHPDDGAAALVPLSQEDL